MQFIYWLPTRYVYYTIYAISNLDDDDRLKNWVDNFGYIKLYNKLVNFTMVLIWILLNMFVFYLIGT